MFQVWYLMQLADLLRCPSPMTFHLFIFLDILHVLSSLQNSCVKISRRPGMFPTTGHVNVPMFKASKNMAVQRRYWNLRAVGARLAEGLRKEDMGSCHQSASKVCENGKKKIWYKNIIILQTPVTLLQPADSNCTPSGEMCIVPMGPSIALQGPVQRYHLL